MNPLLDSCSRTTAFFYLDAHCSHDAADFSVLIALDATERAAYEACGHGYLDRLAYDIHYSAPGVRGSRSLCQARNFTVGPRDQSRRADAAVNAWRSDQRTE